MSAVCSRNWFNATLWGKYARRPPFVRIAHGTARCNEATDNCASPPWLPALFRVFHSFARGGDRYRVHRHLEAEQFGRGHGQDGPILNND